MGVEIIEVFEGLQIRVHEFDSRSRLQFSCIYFNDLWLRLRLSKAAFPTFSPRHSPLSGFVLVLCMTENGEYQIRKSIKLFQINSGGGTIFA